MLALRLVRKLGTASHIAPTAIPSTEIAKSVAGSIVPNGSIEPLKFDEPALIKIKKERDPEKLFSLFKANAYNKVVLENRFAFEDTVSRLFGAGRLDYIENLLEHQKTLPQGRREGFVIRIIMLYGKAGMIDHAVNTFFDMDLYGCHRTVKSFNATLKVLAQTRNPEKIDSFLRDAPLKAGIKLDVYSLNIFIKALCEMETLDRAHIVLLEMENTGIQPDVITYTTLISAFYKINHFHIGNGLWNLMVLKGCHPNLATFNARIQYLVNFGRAWDAYKLVRLMNSLSIASDGVTYNLLIKGFFRAGLVGMAKKVFSHLQRKGLQPNIKIYQTMIHYLWKAHEFDMAFTMAKDIMTKNMFPSIDTVQNLLEGLQKSGEIDKARCLLALAKKRVPPFSPQHMEILESLLPQS